MSKERYVPIRPGIMEHLLRGDISAFEFGVYVMIHLQADFSTGIWRGSAPRILNSAPRGADLRKIQRAIEHLTSLGLLKTFNVQGKRGNYPVLINKFTVRSGALTGMRLNACESESWKRPVYESCADIDAESDAEDAPIQEVRSKREEGKKNPAAKNPPPDSRHKPFFDFAYEAFRMKYLQAPTWDGRHGNGLRAFLKRNPTITLDEWQRRYRNFMASTDAFYRQQKGSLLYFAANFDRFIDGPILEKGKGNGKLNTNEAVAETMRGFAANSELAN